MELKIPLSNAINNKNLLSIIKYSPSNLSLESDLPSKLLMLVDAFIPILTMFLKTDYKT